MLDRILAESDFIEVDNTWSEESGGDTGKRAQGKICVVESTRAKAGRLGQLAADGETGWQENPSMANPCLRAAPNPRK